MSLSQESPLWLYLIFPHVSPTMLLVLRLVCKMFCKRLNEATALWIPYTMERPFMSYAERMQGWRGVLAARVREGSTRENATCSVVNVEVKHYRQVQLVSHRLVWCGKREIELFCCFTGEPVAKLSVHYDKHHVGVRAVCDRWLPLQSKVDGKPILLDCVACRVMEVPTSFTHPEGCTIAGPCISYSSGLIVEIFRVSINTHECTVVTHLSTINMKETKGTFVSLCSGGRSWVHLNKRDNTMRLVDTHTQQCVRKFLLREFVSFFLQLPLPDEDPRSISRGLRLHDLPGRV